MTDKAAEPVVALDEYTTEYLLLKAKEAELGRVQREFDQLKAAFQARVGRNYAGTIEGQEVFTHRPINNFRGKEFRDDHPILAKAYTETVEKEELDVAALKRDHPALYAEYQSRQFRIVGVK